MKRWLALTAILQAFNGLSGIVGGVGLVANPTGLELGMDPAWLESTPFNNYLIPGIVLLVVNGLGNVGGFFATVRKHPRAGEIASIFGAIMMIWIVAQVAWIGYKNFLQPFYFATGLLQIVAGILLIRSNR